MRRLMSVITGAMNCRSKSGVITLEKRDYYGMDLSVHMCIATSPYFPMATSPAVQASMWLGCFGFSSITVGLLKNRSGGLNFSLPECSISLSLSPMPVLLQLLHVQYGKDQM